MYKSALIILLAVFSSVSSYATSCVGPDGDFTIEDEFKVGKIEKAYRICGVQKNRTAKVDEDGCVLFLKPKAKLVKNDLLVSEGSYPVAAKGHLCGKKSDDVLKLEIKTNHGKCCGYREWVSWDVNECKKMEISPKHRMCLWENVRWEIAPEKSK